MSEVKFLLTSVVSSYYNLELYSRLNISGALDPLASFALARQIGPCSEIAHLRLGCDNLLLLYTMKNTQ